MKAHESKLQDADMQGTGAALVRAAERARKLAQQTGTCIVVVRDGQLVREAPAADRKDGSDTQTP